MKNILFILLITVSPLFAEWTTLKSCRLVENASNDADSFVISCSTAYRGQKENRFRLYFVDAAETDSNSEFKRDRLSEQAEYWERDDPDFALRIGLRSSQTVKKMLRQRFTVYTKGEYAPSMGRPRYYALIEVDGQMLDEFLVEEGLVRIYGKGTDLPDGTSQQTHWRKLEALERRARNEHKNGWRGADAIKEIEKKTPFKPYNSEVSTSAWVYSIKSGQKVAALPAGTPVSVMAPENSGRVRIRFELKDSVYEGLCDPDNLKN